MEFRRWGNLTPQTHTPDPTSFHRAPVKYGFYAFPKGICEKFLLGGFGNVLNGRFSYVRDLEGKKVMMTMDEFKALFDSDHVLHESDEIDGRGWWKRFFAEIDQYVLCDEYGVVRWAPDKWKTIEGMKVCDLGLSTKQGALINYYYSDNPIFNRQDAYPLVKKNNKPTKFEYKGNIWHHLEWTDSALYFYRHKEREVEYDPDDNLKFKRIVRSEDVIRKSGSWILTDMKTFEKALAKSLSIKKHDFFMMQKREGWGLEGRPGGLPKKLFDWDEYEVFIEKV